MLGCRCWIAVLRTRSRTFAAATNWATAGTKRASSNRRTNTFHDFIDAAEFLRQQHYTGAGRIVASGGSAGGTLTGAVANEAPQLWGAVISHVPFVDVLNTILDETLPLTEIEWTEWGNPITDKKAFKFIRSYSPYDQLKHQAYPPMLVTAGLNDPRVTYWEAAKYVAKLRSLKTDDNLLLLKTNMGAGHQGRSGRYDSLREVAEEYAFVLTVLNAPAGPGTGANAPVGQGTGASAPVGQGTGASAPVGVPTAEHPASEIRAGAGG